MSPQISAIKLLLQHLHGTNRLQPVLLFVRGRDVLWRKNRVGGRVNVILFSHLNSPWSGSRLPPKPLPVNDLQGRLCCCRRSTEELITRQCRGFVLSICPSLALERKEKRDRWRARKRRRRGLLSFPGGLASFHSRLSWWPSGPARFILTLRCIACLLSHNDIVNGNNTSAYLEVSAATMAEWRRNGKANSSRCHLEVFGGTLLLGRVCRWKIRLILHIAGWLQNLVSNAIFISQPPFPSLLSPFLSNCRVKHFFFLLLSLGKKKI